MNKYLLTISVLFLATVTGISQDPINISEARSKSIGTTVTVTGIVTSGSEFGNSIRYFQDETGGLAGYSSIVGTLKRGDSIVISGVLNEYKCLLELDPVNSVSVISSNHSLPNPQLITPSEMTENLEGQLVQINSAGFNDPSGTFQGNKNYYFTATGQQGIMRTNTSSNIVGEPVPTNEVSISAILGQYSYDEIATEGYQLLLRDKNDLISGSSVNINSEVTLSNLSTTGFTLDWTTDTESTSEIFYGNTPELELGKISEPALTNTHSISITGAEPSELFYVNAFSVKGQDTAKTSILTYITQSESTGDIKVYFNRSVDNSLSTGTDAIKLDKAIDDTLIRYIERAKLSIDMSIYNFNNLNISNISNALNAAHSRGVTVRVIYDNEQVNSGINELIPEIGTLPDVDGEYPNYGIMHNKFFVIDANSSDANDPIVWTGSTNLTDGQINRDANSVIIIQDQSLAKAYQVEFNEMFGSEGANPDQSNSKFGPDKTDNTPHKFIINDKKVELYFSPSDGTHNRIKESINSADHNLNIATMLITKTDLAYAISDRANAGVNAQVLIDNDVNSNGTVVETLTSALGVNFVENGESGIMHHKYMIVDHASEDSDPQVLVGCHNWSSSAEYRNDENTLIIHDASIANIYYQEFSDRFSYGKLLISAPDCSNDYVTIDQGGNINHNVTENDDIPGAYTMSISENPNHGTANKTDNNTISYTPEVSFFGLDTIVYKVTLNSDPSLYSEGKLIVLVQEVNAVTDLQNNTNLKLYPSPATNTLYIEVDGNSIDMAEISVTDITGRTVIQSKESGNKIVLDISQLKRGLYFLKLKAQGIYIKSFIVQ